MKRLVFCFDGTWNRLDSEYPTNVVLTAETVIPLTKNGTAQLIFYDEGVGTDKNEKFRGGIFGDGLVKNLADGYRFLIFNYTPGDEIYVFGFSRGAYTARSFAGMLNCCGVLLRKHAAKVEEAIELYKERDTSEKYQEKMRKYRLEHSPEVVSSDEEEIWRRKILNEPNLTHQRLAVSYLGVWDTVGALGIPERYKWLSWLNKRHEFHDTDLSDFVKSARHAVAIDERRIDFKPTLWTNLDKLNAKAGKTFADVDAPFRQEWFPGVHSAVGGGGDRRGLSDQALDWVLDGARAAGLALDSSMHSRIYELKPEYTEFIECSSDTGLTYKAMNMVGTDRSPGPTLLHEVSVSARRRWLEKPKNLKDGEEYRPGTLDNVKVALNALDPSIYDLGGDEARNKADYDFHEVQIGDTLSKIAGKYYNDTNQYMLIFEANKNKLDNPNRIYPGQLLRIPKKK